MDKILKTYKDLPLKFEWISPTKRIRRENIVSVGDLVPIESNSGLTVGDEPQVEFKLTHYTCYETIDYVDGYLLLSYSDYVSINEKVSISEGFSINNSTELYYDIAPSFAKIDISYNEDGQEKYDLACVMFVSAQIQEKYPEIFDNLNFVTSVEYTDEFAEVLKTEGY